MTLLLQRARRAALLLGLLIAPAGPASAQFGPQGPPAVGVQEAARRPMTERAEFVGRIEAVERVELRPRVTGFLQEVLFREGQEVDRGQPLYRIERQTFEAEVARSQASVAAAEAELANARASLERARELVRTAAGTRVSLDNAVAQERTAQAQLLGARAALRATEISLGYAEIAAPISGQIGRTNRTAGNVVGPGDAAALATIVSQDPMRVAFPISVRQAGELYERYVRRGGVSAVLVRLRTASGRLYPHPGRIEFVDNQVERSTDTILVRALVPNPPRDAPAINPAARAPGPDGVPRGDRELIDGQFVSVLVEGVEPVMAVTLPRTAVLQDQRGSYAFVLDGQGRATRRDLSLGRGTAEYAVVEGGLEAGETVIVEGIQRVRPGQAVNAAPAGPPPAAAAASR